MKPLSFYLLTDTHYFEPSLGAKGAAYDNYMRKEQMCMAENAAVVRATFDAIIADASADTVIIPGDLTKNGEKESHKSFIKELERLKNAGKRVYIITALHDFNDAPRAYQNDGVVSVEGTARSELYELYRPFGFDGALAFDEKTLSYAAEISEGVRLLAINCDDETGENDGSLSDRLLLWIKEQAQTAKRDGCFIFAMTHYPVIPPVPLFELITDAKIREWRKIASFLADNGIRLIFTGHMHIQSVNEYLSEKNNRLIDVCTSALPGSPAKYRKIQITGNGDVRIESLDVPPFVWDMGGLSNKEYFDRQFRNMVQNTLKDGLKGGARGILGKILCSITVGGAGRLLFIRVKGTLAKKKLIDFITEVVLAIFAGDMPFTEGTPEGAVARKALKRLRFMLKRIEPKLIKDKRTPGLETMLLSTLGKTGRFNDNHTVIKKEDLV